MNLINYCILFSIVLLILNCSNQRELKISITNPNNISLTDVFVSVDVTEYPESFLIHDGEKEIAYQYLKSSGKKEIGLVINLDANEKKYLRVRQVENKVPAFKSRTYAELAMKPGNVYIDGKFRGDKFVNVTSLKVPDIHTDHDALFKYEGPGWESEKVGYRFYLDWRNANDIFGKKVNELLLADIGVNDTVAKDDSYHQMQRWGMDIFKVGSSLGIGSIGMWYDNKVNMVSKTDSIYCEIYENGPLRSTVRTSYFGWLVGENKYRLASSLSITAGSRLTKCELDITNNPENVVTGLAKYEGTDFIRHNSDGEWAYIALYGNQTLVGPEDKLGIAVFYKQNELLDLHEDELSYILRLKPEAGKVEYYFCAAWEQEKDGLKNRNEFLEYLDDTLILLNHPVVASTN